MAKPRNECTVTFEINRLKDGESNSEVLQPCNVQYSGRAEDAEEEKKAALSQWRKQMASMGIMTI